MTDKLERDLSVGTAWLVVLAVIAGADDPIHGYEIAKRLADDAPEACRSSRGRSTPCSAPWRRTA